MAELFLVVCLSQGSGTTFPTVISTSLNGIEIEHLGHMHYTARFVEAPRFLGPTREWWTQNYKTGPPAHSAPAGLQLPGDTVCGRNPALPSTGTKDRDVGYYNGASAPPQQSQRLQLPRENCEGPLLFYHDFHKCQGTAFCFLLGNIISAFLS